MMTQEIEMMLSAQTFAVVGASRRPDKYGFLVYKSLKTGGKMPYAVNPQADEVDGDQCYPTLTDLSIIPEVAVMVVPPVVTEAAVAECTRLGIRGVWMQPGAESVSAVAACRAADIAIVSGGPCIMVLLRTQRYAL